MGVSGRLGIFTIGILAFMTLPPQKSERDTLLSDISTGKTRVVDLSYAINDKLVSWPGDEKWFEAKINATVEKNGYFTRSFWMLEHYGTHLDAPIHYDRGSDSSETVLWCGRCLGHQRGRREECRLSGAGGARRRVGEKARPDFRRIDCAVEDGVGFTLAGRAEVSQSRCAGEDAFSRVLGGGGKTIDLTQSERNWLRHNERGLRGVGGFRGAPSGAGSGLVSP